MTGISIVLGFRLIKTISFSIIQSHEVYKARKFKMAASYKMSQFDCW